MSTSFATPLLSHRSRSSNTPTSEEGSPPTPPQLVIENGGSRVSVLANAANEFLGRTGRVDAPCLLAGRYVSLGSAFTLSAAAKLGFIPISLRLPAGPLFATCNSLAFLSLEFWAAKAAINEVLGPKTPNERILESRSALSTEKRSIIILNATLLSLISQLPSGFAVYHYNSPVVRVPAAIISIVANSFFPFRSIQLTLAQAVARRPRNETEVMLYEIKQRVLAPIDCNGIGVELDSPDDEGPRVYSYLARFHSSAEVVPPSGDDWCDVATKVFGVALTILMEYALCMFTFESVKEQIANKDWLAGVFAGAVVITTLYLSTQSLVKTSRRIMNLVMRRHKTAIAQRMRPKLTFGLNAAGFIFDGLAIGPTYVIWGDFFKAYPQYGEKDFFQPVLCLAMFLLLYTATLELTDEGVEYALFSWGSPRERAEIRAHRQHEKLRTLIEKTTLADFAVFLSEAPNEVLLEGSQLTQEDLLNYVRGD